MKNAAWTCVASQSVSEGMDHVEEARAKIVQAMECLEDALADGLPAQSPHSGQEEIKLAIGKFKAKIEITLARVAEAEALIFG
jgi:hypothetical protein